MHNNGLIKFFALCFGLVSLYQISFTFITSSVEDKAESYSIGAVSESEINYSEKRLDAYTNYLDSIADQTILDLRLIKAQSQKSSTKDLI